MWHCQFSLTAASSTGVSTSIGSFFCSCNKWASKRERWVQCGRCGRCCFLTVVSAMAGCCCCEWIRKTKKTKKETTAGFYKRKCSYALDFLWRVRYTPSIPSPILVLYYHWSPHTIKWHGIFQAIFTYHGVTTFFNYVSMGCQHLCSVHVICPLIVNLIHDLSHFSGGDLPY